MSSYKCFQCKKQCPEDGHKYYQIVADNYDDTIRQYRVCNICMEENHRYNLKVYMVMGVCFVVYVLYLYL